MRTHRLKSFHCQQNWYYPTHPPITKPYTPFQTLADFQYTETAIIGTLSKDLVNQQLAGLSGPWVDGQSNITVKKYDDMHHALAKAHNYVVKV